MKKTFFAFSMAVLVGFIAAVGLCVRVLFSPETVSTFADGGMRIVVDPGHGGIDGGVTGKQTGVKESDINLQISLLLKDVLTDMGFEVTLTRKTEGGLYGAPTKGFKKRDMQRRKEIIEETDPLMVISVHQNFYPSRISRGGQVFYNKTDERARALASAIQDRFNDLYVEQGAKSRAPATGEYFMLQCTSYPSVIVECGFLSNAKDEAFITSDYGQKKIADSIAAGVAAYLSEFTV